MLGPIPLELVTAGRDLTEPRPSPDGAVVGFVQRWGGRAAIVAVASDGGPERLLTVGPDPAPGRGLGGGCFTWVPARAHETDPSVVYAAVDGELWLQSGVEVRRLTAHGREARAPVVVGTTVVHVVDEAEVWAVDLDDPDDGAATARRLDDGRHEFCFDPAVSPDGATLSWQGWNPPSMPWDAAERVDLDVVSGTITTWRPTNGAVQQPRFAPDGRRTHVDDRTGWLNVRVLEPGDDADADDRAVVPETVEQAGPTWGAGQRSYAWSDDGRRLAFTRNEAGYGSLCVIDVTTGHIDEIGRGVHGQLGWCGDVVVALRSGARTPTAIVRYRPTVEGPPERTTLAVGPASAWDAVRDVLPEPDLVEEVVDGISLHARRYVAGRGRLLVWVHGGPTDQWQVDWRPRITYWWSRGWDVLVVDPRGSTGHGRDYQQALRGRWGRLDVDDTAALVRAAHRAGWATPATTVAVGGSSGGLTVLGLLADHASLVAGGIASYPVSDLRALTEVSHRFEAHYTDTLVARLDDPVADARFRELSPVHRADRIAGPLLVFHGSDDPVVPVAQSEQLAAAITAGGGDVELVVYEGEGHGFRDPANVRDEYERTEVFLAGLVAGGR